MAENVENKNRPTGSNKYSLYAGREEAVNWGQVATDLTKKLELVRDQREAAKQKIIDDTNTALNELSEIAEVQSGDMNGLIIDGSDFSKNTLQTAMQAVRSGLMSPKDYMLIMQKQKDGYKRLSNYAKNFDAKYQEGMAAVESGEASNLQEYFQGTGFSFGNVKNKKLWTDPATGELIMVQMKDDGSGKFVMPKRSEDPDSFQTPASMLQMISFKEQSKDLNEDVKNLVTNNLAEVITADINGMVLSGKDVTSIENFRQIFDGLGENEKFRDVQGNEMTFDDWMTQQARGVVGNGNDAAEYLMNAGLGYSFTMDEGEAARDPKKILAKSDGGSPKIFLSDAQEKEALNLAKNQINSQLDSIVKISAGQGQQKQQDNSTTANNKKIDENINGYLKDINVALTGNDLTRSNAMLEKLVQQRNEQTVGDVQITNIDITDDVILIEYDGGKDPVRIVRTRYGDDNNVSEQTTLPSDIAQLYDLLSPYGNKEGYDLSSSEVEDRVKKNVKLGERGTDRNVGFERRSEKATTDNTANKVFEIDGKEQTIAQYMKSSDGADMGETTSNVRDSRIEREMNKALNRFLSEEDMTAFNNADFSNLKITVGGAKSTVNLTYDTVDEEGKPKKVTVELGEAKRGTTMEELANQLATGMNAVNKAANAKAGSSEMTFEATYPVWLKQNPGKNYQDYLNR